MSEVKVTLTSEEKTFLANHPEYQVVADKSKPSRYSIIKPQALVRRKKSTFLKWFLTLLSWFILIVVSTAFMGWPATQTLVGTVVVWLATLMSFDPLYLVIGLYAFSLVFTPLLAIWATKAPKKDPIGKRYIDETVENDPDLKGNFKHRHEFKKYNKTI